MRLELGGAEGPAGWVARGGGAEEPTGWVARGGGAEEPAGWVARGGRAEEPTGWGEATEVLCCVISHKPAGFSRPESGPAKGQGDEFPDFP